MERDTPAQRIQRYYDEYRDYTDAEIVCLLRAFEPLPDEDDSAWDADTAWRRAEQFVALVDHVAVRRLEDAVELVLERMAVGDPGEMMRAVPDTLFVALHNDLALLTERYLAGCVSPSAGARYWCAQGLGLLRDEVGVDALLDLTSDAHAAVAAEACEALGNLAAKFEASRPRIVAALQSLQGSQRLRDPASRALASLARELEQASALELLAAAEQSGTELSSQTTVRRCQLRVHKKCPADWNTLQATASATVRHCQVCDLDVYLCTDDADTIFHARAGHCIARAEPQPSELPSFIVGRPSVVTLVEPRAERARRWRAREHGIAEAIAGDVTKTPRDCPRCGYPVPGWRKTCYVCGLPLGPM